jgi:hypothetical protein
MAVLDLDCREFEQMANPTPAEAKAFRSSRMELLRDWKDAKIKTLILDIMGVSLTNAPPSLQ